MYEKIITARGRKAKMTVKEDFSFGCTNSVFNIKVNGIDCTYMSSNALIGKEALEAAIDAEEMKFEKRCMSAPFSKQEALLKKLGFRKVQ